MAAQIFLRYIANVILEWPLSLNDTLLEFIAVRDD